MKSLKKIFMIVTIVFFTLCFFSSCDLFNLSYSGSIKFQLANNLDTLKPQNQAEVGKLHASEQKPFITVIIRGVDYSSYSYKLYDDYRSLNNDTLVISGIPRNSKVDVEVWLFNATYSDETYLLEDNKFGTKENVIVTSSQTYVNVKLLQSTIKNYTGSYYDPDSFNVVSQVEERVAEHTDLKSEKLYTFLGKVELD